MQPEGAVIVSNHVTDRRVQRCFVPEQGIQGSRNVVPAYYAPFYCIMMSQREGRLI